MARLRTAIGAPKGPCVPPGKRHSGTLTSAAISLPGVGIATLLLTITLEGAPVRNGVTRHYGFTVLSPISGESDADRP
eukprot:6209480-Pleurochrysis_carterae.AAC.2